MREEIAVARALVANENACLVPSWWQKQMEVTNIGVTAPGKI